MPRIIRRLHLALITCSFTLICLIASAGETRYAARPAVAIRNSNHAFDPVIATIALGQPVDVTGQYGKWARVKFTPTNYASTQPASAIEGFVVQDALASQPPATTQPADGKPALAAGGVLNSTEYGTANGLDPDALAKAIIDSHEAMKNADMKFNAFMKAGHLSAYKAASATTQPAN